MGAVKAARRFLKYSSALSRELIRSSAVRRRAGVTLAALELADLVAKRLLMDEWYERQWRLMVAIDHLNGKYGRDTVRCGILAIASLRQNGTPGTPPGESVASGKTFVVITASTGEGGRRSVSDDSQLYLLGSDIGDRLPNKPSFSSFGPAVK